MSLVTRCPACLTMFRVVPDQLRISGGWVRCGHCNEVFDGAGHMLSGEESAAVLGASPPPPPPPLARLQDDRATTAPWRDEVPVASGAASVAASSGAPSIAHEPDDISKSSFAATVAPPPVHAHAGSDDQTPEAGPATTTPPSVESVSKSHVEPSAAHDTPGAVATPIAQDDVSRASEADLGEGPLAPPPTHTAAEHPWSAHDLPAPASAVAEEDTSQAVAVPTEPEASAHPFASVVTAAALEQPAPTAPSFVAAAQRRAFWSSWPVRAALWLLLIGLLLGLAAQAALSQRDWLAAREPRLTPLLQALCQPMGCEVSPYRMLDAIVIDSSAFNRASGDEFRFTVVLRNTSDMPIATPALELVLTDAQDRQLVRRVVTAAELGAPVTLAARDEFSGARTLTVADSSVSPLITGYRLMAFYP
ncbi:DUF3426 domain-containing protein [Ottowia sp. SB7-C50]|uniref:DUF3426 domain-containing protein n=1 Tax=Ottowia sp. SB7-C50 TaxID=3081231 RepID=UPI002954965B|nr:DUF3426 domain-containing protein [Ottowia sp. SB7-C50]WOP16204.1 DUF3426 domain-containing protein [Ottowia sp. SB7-C50]